ncbi:MAG: FtsX-like permease family protein [Gammaproteobacteria bacterium]|nr:FtsX-like permease family protein [Gammaproteobacteria bacterium]
MRHTLRLAGRLLKRDGRAGEIQALLFALAIAAATTTAITAFAERLKLAFGAQTGELLGADLVVESSRPIPEAWLAQADARGLRHTNAIEFASMAVADNGLQLVGVKAVGNDYPLRGSVRVAAEPYGVETPAPHMPETGTLWIESRLFAILKLKLGDRLRIGDADFRVAQVLGFEPSRGGDILNLSPRVLMQRDDLPRTQVIQPGSRVSYRALFAGKVERIAAYRQWLEPKLGEPDRLIDARTGRPAIGNALDKAERYLGLASLVAIGLAGVAVAMAARRYSLRHYDTSAMLRCLGAVQRDIVAVYLWQMLLLGLAGSAVGAAFGWLAQIGLVRLLAGLLPLTPPHAGAWPLLLGVATGLVTLAGFALPPVMRLRQVPPLRVLRRDLAPLPPRAWLVYGVALLTLFVLMWRYTGDRQLTLFIAGGAAASMLLLLGVALLLLRMVRRLRQGAGTTWRFGIDSLWRRGASSIGQIAAFGLVILAMSLTTLLRTDLLASWQTQLPDDTPNQFAINILPEVRAAFAEFLAQEHIRSAPMYPVVRGRLIAINGTPVRQAVTKEAQDSNALHRDLNLTWSATLPADNRIVAGEWLNVTSPKRVPVSVEAKLAERLGLKLGDELEFLIADQTLRANIASLRSVDWDSFRPNFYMIFPPGVLESIPGSAMTSFYLAAERQAVLQRLVAQFPAVTVLDVGALLAEVRRIFEQVTLAVEYILLFVLLASLAVLFAVLASSHDERIQEGALLRALGASRRQVRSGHFAEFALLGLLAGLLAAAGTELIAWLLYTRIFHLDYVWHGAVWLAAPLCGMLGIALAGLWGTRTVLSQPPAVLLRES